MHNFFLRLIFYCFLLFDFFGIVSLAYARPPDVVDNEFKTSFFPKPLFIGAGVFWPENAIRTYFPFMDEHAQLFKDKTVYEIGTGSGIIALYAAKLGAKKVVATDISDKALRTARINAERLGYAEIIETRLVSADNAGAYAVLKPEEKFDIVISNPPYNFTLLSLEDEPEYDDDGNLAVSIIEGLRDHLNPNGYGVFQYYSFYSEKFFSKLASSRGYQVRSHPSDRITHGELRLLYKSFHDVFVKRLKLDPKELEIDFSTLLGTALPEQTVTPLFEGQETKKFYPGMIILKVD